MSAFDKIIGYKEIKEELIRICDTMKNSQNYKKLGVTTPRGLILYGDPGVGKTLMANCLMAESGRKQFICRKDQSDGCFVSKIYDIFEEARAKAPSIVLLDDMDKFSDSNKRNSNEEEYVTVQSCIDDCKNSEVFVIATCNSRYSLPESLLRAGRFDTQLRIYNPTGEECEKIVEYYLKDKNCAKDVNTKEIAKMLEGGSCAELETIVNQGGIFAGYQGKEQIEMSDMIEAILQVLFNSPKSARKNTPTEAKSYAVHEAGHAVVGEILNPNSVHLVSIRKHIGDVGGFTFFDKDENYWHSLTEMEKRVTILLAGRAATEVVLGEVDTGAENDILRAERLLGRFAIDFCKFGFSKRNPGECFQDLNQEATKAIYQEIERYYNIAKNIVSKNIEFLNKIADSLIKNETITAKEIQNIKKTCKICK